VLGVWGLVLFGVAFVCPHRTLSDVRYAVNSISRGHMALAYLSPWTAMVLTAIGMAEGSAYPSAGFVIYVCTKNVMHPMVWLCGRLDDAPTTSSCR